MLVSQQGGLRGVKPRTGSALGQWKGGNALLELQPPLCQCGLSWLQLLCPSEINSSVCVSELSLVPGMEQGWVCPRQGELSCAQGWSCSLGSQGQGQSLRDRGGTVPPLSCAELCQGSVLQWGPLKSHGSCPRQSPAARAGTPHLNRQSSDGLRDTGATPCLKQFPFPWLFPSQAQWCYLCQEGFWESHSAIPGETTQLKNTSKFYFSILLYFTFSRKFLHSSTNLTKSLKFRTNNPGTYYKHEFFVFFFFLILQLVLAQLHFFQLSEELFSQHNF